MDNASANQLILSYVQGWLAADREQILSTLDPACVVIESYGPTYRGKEMVGRWIDSWFAPGNVVTRWEITSFTATSEECFFEWDFACISDGERGGFEGASIARLSEGRIVYLREYATTAPRHEWEG
ncbi:nuclear transport factor 2 family protein [Ktedonosporobacter rubrisoli]|uniref:Nuclear transport factor 2 family protein n=1 Tax=Ktedonosporobacter rubrisoli TaxID=2509675 RepID=A0A4P6JZC2_KTERU|nr:nuclear transport factor 2 family protein [Ktedonosporobacter rubrisoli]QBD80843.1 nuclear transport factor 2 family protein [Ktedonosporobacter rubrisoli]